MKKVFILILFCSVLFVNIEKVWCAKPFGIEHFNIKQNQILSFLENPILVIKNLPLTESDLINQEKEKIVEYYVYHIVITILVLVLFGLIVYYLRKKKQFTRVYNQKIEAISTAFNQVQENNKSLEQKIRSRTEEVIDHINLNDDILTKLNLSEVKFEKLFSKNSDAMALIDFESFVIIDINAAALEMFDLSKVTKGKDYFINSKSETSNIFLLKVAAIIKENQEVTDYIISQNISPSNQKWYSITSQIISVNSKKYYFVNAKNITKRKKAEISLIESEKRLKMLTENINDMIWLLDTKLHITYVSPSIFINLGIQPEEVEQKSITCVLTQNSYAKFKDIISEHIKDRVSHDIHSFTLELEFIHKNGTIQLAEFRAKFVESSHNQLSIHGVSRDISKKVETEMALRKSEELYRLITNNVSDVIFTADTSLNIKYTNKAVESFLGYSTDEIIELSYNEYLTPFYVEKLELELTKFFNNIYEIKNPDNKLIFESEIEFIAKNGESKWGYLQISLLLDEKQFIFGLIGTIHDNTQNHKLEIVRQNTNDFFKKLFFESPVMMVIVDKNGIMINGNNAFLSKTAYSIQEIQNKSIRSLFYEENSNIQAESFHNIIKSEKGKIKTNDNRAIDVLYDFEIMSNTHSDESYLIVMRDITLQLKAEKAALEQQQQFKALSEHSPDIIARYNSAIECTYINPIVKDELNLDPAHLIGKNIRQIGINTNDAEYLFNNYIQVFIDGIEKIIDFSLVVSGETKHYQSQIIPEYYGSDRVQTIMVVTRNMSEYIKAIMMLQNNIKQMAFINKAIIYCNQSKTLFELYRNIIQIIIQEYGFDGGGVYSFNEEKQYAQLVHEHVLSPTFTKKVNIITSDHPYYNKLFVDREAVFITSKNPGLQKWHKEFNIKSIFALPILNKDKVIGSINLRSEHDVEINESNINMLKTLSQELGSAIERIQAIAMHLESEENYKSLVETTTDLVWKVNEYFVYTFVSSKSIDLIGYSPDEMIGSSIISTIAVEEHIKIKKFLDMNKTLLEKFTLVDVPLIQKNGKIVHVEINGYPLIDVNGTFIGYAGINRDISIRKVNEDLRNRKEIAERMAQIKQQFVSNISHEFRTPLTAIIGHSEIISNKVSDIEMSNHIQNIQSNSKSLLRLINDILDLSKIEAGKLSLQKESTNIYKFFDDIKLTFAPLAKTKNIDFLVEINQSPIQSVLIDELRLRQIVNNIVANAIKFTETGFVKVAVNILYSDLTSNTIDMIISVSDSGIGIAPNQLNSIWNSFTQADGQSNKKYGGTGLGLSICKNLVELMEGSISIDSKENQGTTFRIIIPSIELSSEQAKNEFFNPLLENKTILVVDENKNLFDELMVKLVNNNCNINQLSFEHVIELESKFLDTNIIILQYDHLLESPNFDEIHDKLMLHKNNTIFISNDLQFIENNPTLSILSHPLEMKKLHDTLFNTLNKLFDLDKSIHFDLIQAEMESVGKEFILEIVKELESSCSTLWIKASSNNSIDQIKQFERAIFKIAKSSNTKFLKQYSNEILIGLKTFDVEKLKVLLDIYPKIIKYLKNN